MSGLNPTVPKQWLLAIAGSMWAGVGILLCTRAIIWLAGTNAPDAFMLGTLGIALAVLFYMTSFLKVADHNIRRICELGEQPSIFLFIAPKAYVMVGFMMALGFILRSSPIPRDYLAVPYAAMGGSLILGSLRLYRRLWLTAVHRKPCPAGPSVSKSNSPTA
ncbi:MAG TPA: hypothetical protein DCP63_08225 [Bacteroidetes bacterium]|nr:hypothetical protein [Bacteroidota bacterium]